MKGDKLKRDFISYLIVFILALFLWFIAIPQQIVLRNSWSGDVAFTSRTFPNLLTIGFGIVSVLGMISTAWKYRALKEEDTPVEKHSLQWKITPWLVFAIIVVYAILFSEIGYIISSAIVCPILLFVLDCRNWKYYVTVYAFAAAMYVIFRIILLVPLP